MTKISCEWNLGTSRLVGLPNLMANYDHKKRNYAATTFFSLSAAYERHARISSLVKSGKSSINSSVLIPEAKYSNTSTTAILVPRMQGFPNLISGCIVIRLFQFIGKIGENLMFSQYEFVTDRIRFCLKCDGLASSFSLKIRGVQI